MMSKLKVTRDQLSKFIEDNNTVTQFERIFKLIDSLVIARTDISTDYEYTTTAQYMSYLVIDGLSADITITVTDGGFDERSRFKVLNNDPTYKIIMTDGTLTFWVAPGQVVDFYLKGTTLVWASAGWERLWKQDSYADYWINNTALSKPVVAGNRYEFIVWEAANGASWTHIITINNTAVVSYGQWSASAQWTKYTGSNSTSRFETNFGGYRANEVSLWHNGS